METKVYVDVLLVINYIVNLLLVQCTAKLTGQRPGRRRMVAAALFGSASALTIFLPFFSFFTEFLLRVLLAAAIVRIAFPYRKAAAFAKHLFVFFAVSFFFSGIMLALWLVFAPPGMYYYNGIVYFNVSSLYVIGATMIAYAVLTLVNRFAREGRLKTDIYRVRVEHGEGSITLLGLVDTGNRLYEPFSNTPVSVCGLETLSPLLPPEVVQAIERGEHLGDSFARLRFPVRLVAFDNVGGSGLIPAFRPDRFVVYEKAGNTYREREVPDVYLALADRSVGGAGYNIILNPDLLAVHI